MDPIKRKALDEFGAKLMAEVRDEACSYLQRVISGKMRDAGSKELFRRYRNLDEQCAEVLHRFLGEAVDACLVRFLHFIDVNEIPLVFKTSDGQHIDVQAISDGLVGEVHNETGWIARFSKFKDRVEPAR